MSPFFFKDTATTEIYTLSLHDALPIWAPATSSPGRPGGPAVRRPTTPRARALRLRDWELRTPEYRRRRGARPRIVVGARSEEHTSELQSRLHLVCRLLLEKKKRTRDDI